MSISDRVFAKPVVLASILVAVCLISALFFLRVLHPQTRAKVDGAAMFASKCATCHRVGNDMRAPEPAALRQMSKSAILAALGSGKMSSEGKVLTRAEKIAIADALAAVDSPIQTASGGCARDLDPPPNPPRWLGWGADLHNTRFQRSVAAGLRREQADQLKLKWAFGFPGAIATYGQPTSYAARILVGSEDGTVYALDAATGCSWWQYKASATVKTAISVSQDGTAAFFGDTNGYVYAVKFSDGSQLWKVRPESHPAARITGSPLLVGNRLYVPISSGEEGAAADPNYPCCTFRGSVAALDASTGKQIWHAYTIAEAPKPTRRSASGLQYSGPSGAAVWSSPTADLKRAVIYVATGNNYSDPPTTSSDAVIAFDMNSGKRLWSRQFTAVDRWNAGCVAEKKDNCPNQHGDDYDFGAPPLLTSVNGREILVLAQKSGIVYALDPARQGDLIWKTRIAKGGPLGGIQWGGAADHHYAYFPVSDFDFDNPTVGGGVYALDLRDGKVVWHVEPPKPACAGQFGCSPAQMSPPTLAGGVLFAGSLDGYLRAYDARDGRVLWSFDTTQDFHTTNGIKAHGGGMSGSGPTIVSGMMYVNTGYTNAMAGNALLAFSIEPTQPAK